MESAKRIYRDGRPSGADEVVFLLPKSEEAERMKEELTGMLVEYSACEEVAAQLRSMAEGVYTVVREPAEVELIPSTACVTMYICWRKRTTPCRDAAVRSSRPCQEQFEPLTTAPFVSVTSRIMTCAARLDDRPCQAASPAVRRARGRSQTVATFLAVLELVRAGRIAIADDESLTVRTGRKCNGIRPLKTAREAGED